jgi:Cu/Ag efflux protein CusF
MERAGGAGPAPAHQRRNTLKAIHAITAGAFAAATAFTPLMAQPASGHDMHARHERPSAMTGQGQVRKIDAEHRKVTLQHEATEDMPAMTMVYQVTDPAALAKVKVGDAVRFRTGASASTITDLQAAH